ncbi:hypothetical protein WCX49_11785 [Sulfurimonas sp. HSL-1656]|uniref:hypothetical protein n=1 Tax=Thiomicrolovo subterrani TaxID=3131934 RepID=UPI0031F78A5F
MAEEVMYSWQSQYLDGMPFEAFALLDLEAQAKLAKKTFSNFIKYALKVGPRDRQQAEFIFELDDALATKVLPDVSVRSGHGTGKTTILSWLILYVGLVYDDVKIPATAPAAPQLINMLLPEVKKWHKKMHPRFARLVEPLTEDVKFRNGNKCFARTARKENTEALAGVHATFVLYIIDEASGVDQRIFEVIEGALTGDYLRVMTSNPTRTAGTFFDSHNKNKSLYRTVHMDSEKSANVKPSWIEMMAKKYGRESSVYKVRVRGQFPDRTTDALFDMVAVDESMAMDVNADIDRSGVHVWALDVARFGDDTSQLTKRRGYEVYEMTPKKHKSTMELALFVANQYTQAEHKPDAVVVDTIGVGAGVFDRLIELGVPAIEGNASMAADDDAYLNKRAEMYFGLANFIRKGGSIPKDDELYEELSVITYSYTDGNGKSRIKILKKEEIKEILGRSPDKADSLALQFFTTIVPQQNETDEWGETQDHGVGGWA